MNGTNEALNDEPVSDLVAQLSIYDKLHSIMSELDFIQKDKVNPHHKYSYASEHAIKAAVQPLLVKYKVLFQLSAGKPELTSIATVVPVLYRFICTETGGMLEGHFTGSGATRDEKGLYAGITGAIKYILTSTFLIPTGDDAEADAGTPAPAASAPSPRPAAPATKAAPKPAAKPASPGTPRAELEKRFFESWNRSRTAEQAADKDDWKHRGDEVKEITGSRRFKKVAEMTDAELVLCIDAWTAKAAELEGEPVDDAPAPEETEFNF